MDQFVTRGWIRIRSISDRIRNLEHDFTVLGGKKVNKYQRELEEIKQIPAC